MVFVHLWVQGLWPTHSSISGIINNKTLSTFDSFIKWQFDKFNYLLHKLFTCFEIRSEGHGHFVHFGKTQPVLVRI